MIERDRDKIEIVVSQNQNLLSCQHYNNVCEIIEKIKSRSRSRKNNYSQKRGLKQNPNVLASVSSNKKTIIIEEENTENQGKWKVSHSLFN